MKLTKSILGHREFTSIPDGIYELKVRTAEIRPSSMGDRVFVTLATDKGAIVGQSWPVDGDASKYLAEFVAATLGEGVELTDTDQLVGKTLTAAVRTRNGLTNVFPRFAKKQADGAEPAQPSDDAPVTE